jgi:hypothetical protein
MRYEFVTETLETSFVSLHLTSGGRRRCDKYASGQCYECTSATNYFLFIKNVLRLLLRMDAPLEIFAKSEGCKRNHKLQLC